MDNVSIIKGSRAKLRQMISGHLVTAILIPMAKELKEDAEQKRISEGHNMTGNTVNEYACAVFVDGSRVWDSFSNMIRPLRTKLHIRQRFRAGSQRWDGEIQGKTFKAPVETSGQRAPDKVYSFLGGYKAIAKGWEVVVCNAVEYASYQETEMGIDVLTSNFNYAQIAHHSFFKPLPS